MAFPSRRIEMKRVIAHLKIWIELEVDDDIAEDEDKLLHAINELDYSFNSYDTEKKVQVNDYFIPVVEIVNIS
jgi:hypothetical protein